MITFSETTGILDQRDIERKMRMWRFDVATGTATITWTNDDGMICSEPIAWDGGPLTINSFTNQFLDPNVGRCAALNGTENFVLMENGGWDVPLKDDDIVCFVPAVGWVQFVYLALKIIAAILLAYAIYAIATMETPDGSGAASTYSLSSLQNKNRYGEVVERQYGKLKRFPSYAIKPYTEFRNNEQYFYTILCVGYGKFEFDANDPYGIEDTTLSAFDTTTISVQNPGQYLYSVYFPNNIRTSSEVDATELYATNQSEVEDRGWPTSNNGKWIGWYNANKYGTAINKIILDFIFPSGHYDNYAKGNKINRTTTWEVQYRSVTRSTDDGPNIYGEPISKIYSYKGWKNSAIRLTKKIDVSFGVYQVRCRRTCRQWSSEGRSVTTLQWSALRGQMANISRFDDVTTISISAKATAGLTDSSAKRFYTNTTAIIPVYNQITGVWTDTATRNPVWAICDIWHSPNWGNYSRDLLDMDDLCAWAEWCDENNVYFDYCFDSYTSVDDAIKIVAQSMQCIVDLSSGKLRLVRDEPGTIPTYVFTKENIVADSFTIQYKGITQDEYSGAIGEYTDKTTGETETVDLLKDDTEDTSNPKTITIKGITDRTDAYRHGMWLYLTEKENRAAVSFETTIAGWMARIGTLIYVNFPLFRQHDSGNILSIDGTTVVLGSNVKLSDTHTNTLKIRNPINGTILGTYTATYADAESGDYHTLTLDSAPDVSEMEFDDPQALPIFMLGIGSNFAKKCRVTKIQQTNNGTKIESFIDNELRFAFANSYPDTQPPSQPPAIIPSAPENVTAEPYDPNEDDVPTDITISWDAVSGFDTYIVQYSQDGEEWTAITASTTETSVLLGEYITGNFYARVAVVYNGNIWGWGESGLVYMPTSLTYFAQCATDTSLDVSSDNYIDIQNS